MVEHIRQGYWRLAQLMVEEVQHKLYAICYLKPTVYLMRNCVGNIPLKVVNSPQTSVRIGSLVGFDLVKSWNRRCQYSVLNVPKRLMFQLNFRSIHTGTHPRC